MHEPPQKQLLIVRHIGKGTIFIALTVSLFIGLLGIRCQQKVPISHHEHLTTSQQSLEYYFDTYMWDSVVVLYPPHLSKISQDSVKRSLLLINQYLFSAIESKQIDSLYIEEIISLGDSLVQILELKGHSFEEILTFQLKRVRWFGRTDRKNLAFNRLDKLSKTHPILIPEIVLAKGMIFQDLNQTDSAIAYFQLASQKSHDDLYSIFNCHYQLGKLFYYKGKYQESVPHFEKALVAAKSHSLFYERILSINKSPLVYTYFHLGFGTFMMGLDSYSLSIYKELEDILQEHNIKLGTIDEAGLNQRIARTWMGLQNPERTLEYYRKALVGYERLNEDQYAANILQNIATVYRYQGNYLEAKSSLEKAFTIYQTLSPSPYHLLARTHFNMGRVLTSMEEFEQAAFHFEESNRNFRLVPGFSPPFLANSQLHQGEMYRAEQNWNKARYMYQDVIQLLQRRPGISFERSRAYMRLAELDAQEGAYSSAFDHLQQAQLLFLHEGQKNHPLDISQEDLANVKYAPYFPDYLMLSARILQEKGKAENNPKDLNQSLKTYLLTQQFADTLRTGISTEGDKLEFIQKMHTLYEPALALCWELWEQTQDLQYLEKAFLLMEKGKANVLLEGMNKGVDLQFAGLPPELVQQEKRLKQELTYFEKKIFDAEQANVAADDPQLQTWLGKRFQLRETYDSLKQVIQQDYPKYYQLKYDVQVPTIAEVQTQLLEGDQDLIEYFVGEEHLYMLRIRPDTVYLYRTPNTFPLSQSVQELLAGIYGKYSPNTFADTLLSQTPDLYEQKGWQLYQHLLKPLQDQAALPPKLIIVPDAVLGYVPFDALLEESIETERKGAYSFYPYFFRDHQVCYSYSATLLREMKTHTRTPQKPSLLAVSQSFPEGAETNQRSASAENLGFSHLPYVVEEIKKIRQVYSTRHLKEEKATKDLVLSLMESYAVLHFSTHGILNNTESSYSYLALAHAQPDSSNIGKLFVRDLYALRLQASLVVLSACDMGVGDLYEGEGIISMARGFAYAGAGSIISTLWSVNDKSTAFIMQRFYAHLAEGLPKDVAMHQARKDYLDQENLAGQEKYHPYFWAAYIPVGDMTPVDFEKATPWGLYGVLGGILLLILGYWLVKSRESKVKS